MKKENGFTLVELVISLMIFITISTVMLANFRQGDKSEQLRQSANLLSSSLREAQGKAIAGANAGTAEGYGVVITNGGTSFTTYADTGGAPRELDAGEELYTTNFLKSVSITTSDMDIFFQIPTGTLYIDGASESNLVTITLQHSDTSNSMDITILPFAGQVSVGNIY